jgi:hypothetical protein
VYCSEDVAQLFGSGWGLGVEGQLEQWVRFACMLLGDELFCVVEGLNEEQFLGGQEGSVCYRF